MSQLFFRTLAQGLQAFMPLAVALVWFGARGPRAASRAILWGLAVAVPGSLVAGSWFQASGRQALGEALLAVAALSIALAFLQAVNGRGPLAAAAPPARGPLLIAAVSAAAIVIRQTMEIVPVFGVAAFELRSFDATAAIAAGVAFSAACAALWLWIAPRVFEAQLPVATRALVIVFVAQLVVYAVHEFSEAGLLPWSGQIHAATEPYGPDGLYGVHFSDLLVVAPLLAAVWARSISAAAVNSWSAIWRRRAGRRPALGVLAAAVWIVIGMQHSDARPRAAVAPAAADVTAITARPHLLFRHTGAGPAFGKLALAPLDAPDSERLTTTLTCERVSFGGGSGLCLRLERGVFNTYMAVPFDRSLKPGASIKLAGLPSRTRVSADGRVGAITVFVIGHDYTADFSTSTTLIDLASGDQIGELEEFSTWRDGARFRAADFNFWGVTFVDDASHFYAALKTAGSTYLVRGELGLRRLTVVRGNVECPSLSPDNRRLAYKKRVGPSPDSWRLHVLDLASGVERLVEGEERYVDDQVEWLDAGHLLYGVPRRTTSISDVWVVPVDGPAPARIFLREAESPIVVR